MVSVLVIVKLQINELLKRGFNLDRIKIELHVLLYYGNTYCGDIYPIVMIDVDEYDHLKDLNGQIEKESDIYEELMHVSQRQVEEEICNNDGWWCYDFTEYYNADNPFDITSDENEYFYEIEIPLNLTKLNK